MHLSQSVGPSLLLCTRSCFFFFLISSGLLYPISVLPEASTLLSSVCVFASVTYGCSDVH